MKQIIHFSKAPTAIGPLMSKKENSWYAIANADVVETPALLVYPDRVQHNLQEAMRRVGTPDRLRPHVKTHKSSVISRLQLDAGITRFKCATLAEAEMLGACEAPDVLVAFPLLGPRLSAFLALGDRFPKSTFSAIVDAKTTAKALSTAAIAAGKRVGVYLDLDIGMGRTGIAFSGAEDLYHYCDALPGIQVLGLHAYDGHVRERNTALLQKQCEEHVKPLYALVEKLRKRGYTGLEVIVGGSPSFGFYAGQQDVQCSPGTFVLWDQGYAQDCPDQDFWPAAVLLCRVISLPNAETVCVDLGHKAVGAESTLAGRVHFLDTPGLQVFRQSEEHLVLKAPKGHGLQLGDVLYALPYHICPTVNLYEAYTVVEKGIAIGSWPIDARKRFYLFNEY